MIPLDQNPSRRGRYGKDWHGMSEKGLERETEGISVGEREPVVADSSPKGGRLRSSWKKLWKGRKRKALALLLVVAIAGGVVIWRGRGQTASAATTYQEAAVERRSITNSLSSSGTLEPADSYTVNTLVSGEILSDTFEKGDQVEEGQLLYTIDSSNAASSSFRPFLQGTPRAKRSSASCQILSSTFCGSPGMYSATWRRRLSPARPRPPA